MKTSITAEQLADLDNVTIIDVRKKPAYDEDPAVLRTLGLDARYLEGGIDGWKETGVAVEPKPNTKDQ